MKIIITGRHFEISEDLSLYARKKISKLEKFFHRLIDIEVIMYMEKHNHLIEAVINGDGIKFYGKEKAGDMYSAVDLLAKSMEKQVVKHKEKHSEHKVQPLKNNVGPEFVADEIIDITVNQVANKPQDEVEAFLEMKMENRDFILFKRNTDYDASDNDCYAVIYKSDDGFRMAEIPQYIVKEKRFDAERLLEFNLIVRNDSLMKPKIKLKKCKENFIKSMAMNTAVRELMASKEKFIPFLNDETISFNIIYRNGNNIELMIPST